MSERGGGDTTMELKPLGDYKSKSLSAQNHGSGLKLKPKPFKEVASIDYRLARKIHRYIIMKIFFMFFSNFVVVAVYKEL